MQIHIFMNTIEEMKLNPKFVSSLVNSVANISDVLCMFTRLVQISHVYFY